MTAGAANVVRCGAPPARRRRERRGPHQHDRAGLAVAPSSPPCRRTARGSRRGRRRPARAPPRRSRAPRPSEAATAGPKLMPSTECATSTAYGRPLADQRLDRRAPHVGVEVRAAGRDLDHLVDALQGAGVGQRTGRVGQHGHRDRPGAERRSRADQLGRHVAERPLAVLGDDQDATHERRSATSSTIRCATSGARPGSISAPVARGRLGHRASRSRRARRRPRGRRSPSPRPPSAGGSSRTAGC